MLFKGILAVMAISSLAGLFGCNKPAAPVSTALAGATAQSKIKDLGILQMTNNYETCLKFGTNRDARIIPRMLDRHNIQITLTVESKAPGGKVAGLSVVQMTGSAGQPFQISIGDTDFSFTPQVVARN
jgi:hypothetical protein